VKYFESDPDSVYEAKVRAQQISFAPVVFQASRLLRKYNVLSKVYEAGKVGIALADLQTQVSLPAYGVKVLAEAGLGIGLLFLRDDRFCLTKAGHILLNDRMTRVNIDFVHDVCYRGLFDLEKSILEGRPAGLSTLGEWPTVYEGLSSLPKDIQESWFAFDHFYSDDAFPKALPLVFAQEPKRLLDIGGNTGKWALKCVGYDPHVRVTIVDLPAQIAMMKANATSDRIDGYGMNILDPAQAFPKGYDAIWMSQFLDCFSPEEIVGILRRAAAVMDERARLYILETYWDRQANATAAFCLQQTSLYFTCIANGNSQMYHSRDMKNCLDQAGLTVVRETDSVGFYHTLTECRLG